MTNLSMPRCDIEELKGQIEQLKALNTADDYLIKLLEEQNQQLKELLRECKPYISYSVNKKKYLGFTPPEANILTKIDNAIGEKK